MYMYIVVILRFWGADFNISWQFRKYFFDVIELILSGAIILLVLVHFCGTSQSFQAAILKQEVALINMLPSISPNCHWNLSLVAITNRHHFQA